MNTTRMPSALPWYCMRILNVRPHKKPLHVSICWIFRLLLLVTLFSSTSMAQNVCREVTTNSTADLPNLELQVWVRSIKPNSDMEDFDNQVSFWNNQADLYGRVTIDGESFKLPKIDENDFPHWGEIEGKFSKVVNGPVATVTVDAWDSDNWAAGDDDVVDMSPEDDTNTLRLSIDLCSLAITGDVIDQGRIGTILTIPAGPDENAATTELLITLADNRPATINDLAITYFDLLQVVPLSSRLVVGKPMVAMLSVANNFNVTVDASVNVRIFGESELFNETVPLPSLAAGQVHNLMLFEDNPIVLFGGGTLNRIHAMATLIPNSPLPDTPSPDDCRLMNDGTGRMPWTVINTGRYDILWQRVTTLLDAGNGPDIDSFNRLVDLSQPFIRGTFPIVDVAGHRAGWPLTVPVSAAVDFIATLVSIFQIPADVLVPLALTLELNGVNYVTNHDRMIGVVHRDFFDRFFAGVWDNSVIDIFKNAGGLSLGEFAPMAVLVASEVPGDPPGVITDTATKIKGPNLIVAAHELGHTYGLSVDSSIKIWTCQISKFGNDLDAFFCGLDGGFEESKKPGMAAYGNPASGYWFGKNEDISDITAIVGPQCESTCFMGKGTTRPHETWDDFGSNHWIDKEDYDRLLERFTNTTGPDDSDNPGDGQTIFVGGMIALNGDVYLDDWYVTTGRPSSSFPRPQDERYAIEFLAATGEKLGSVGVPQAVRLIPGTSERIPVTFFSLHLPLPRGTYHIGIVDRSKRKTLIKRQLSPVAPEVTLSIPKINYVGTSSANVSFAWSALDDDGDTLKYNVLLSEDGQNWAAVAYKLPSKNFELKLNTLEPGRYASKVQAADGTNLGESDIKWFTVPRKRVQQADQKNQCN